MIKEFTTIRDFLRYAVTEFNQAKLTYGHGVSNAYEDAFYLIFDSLDLPLTDENCAVYFDAKLSEDEKKLIFDRINLRITKRLPTAYITGRAYLRGLQFKVSPDVLIPRSFIAEILGDYEHPVLPIDPDGVENVLDLCTGSGCLAILAAHIFANAKVDGSDISAAALKIAQENLINHNLQDRVNFVQGDLFGGLQGKKYDLIITNPPYVTEQSMKKLPQEYLHEPALALGAGHDGLDIVRRIMHDARKFLKPDGLLICEIGAAKDDLVALYPDVPFVWFDTVHSSGEVFAIKRELIP